MPKEETPAVVEASVAPVAAPAPLAAPEAPSVPVEVIPEGYSKVRVTSRGDNKVATGNEDKKGRAIRHQKDDVFVVEKSVADTLEEMGFVFPV